MEIVIGVAAKIAEYTVAPIGRYIVCPLVRPIARPFINLWEYDINLKNLKEEMKKLEEKREWVQGLTNVGVESLLAVKAWQNKVNNTIDVVSRLSSKDESEQQSRKCCQGCTYSNLKECYQRRNNVAHKLKDVARLLQEAEKSASSWERESKLKNLKKEVEELVEKLEEEEEKLVARREKVQRLIKDGEEPLQHVKIWQDNVNKIIDEISGLIIPQQQNMQCCSDLDICNQHKNNVDRMLDCVAQLLREAREVEKLKEDVEKLKAKRDTVKCFITVGKEPLPDVKLWQDKVNNIINEVSGRVNSQQQNNVARTLDDVAQLLQEAGEFKEYSFQPIPEETWLQSSEGYKAFESRTSILKEIIDALSKPDVGLVGIYGMGGIGKTTLAKQIARQAIQDKLFNKIVFVEVSLTPDIKKVQGEIGSKLGLEFREEDDSSKRARQLYRQLKDEEKTLLILDNIWESLDFETVGIPFKHDSKGLKLLMTARNSNVLTDGMEYSQHNFSIEPLKWEDAWSLFKSKAGSCVDRRDLHDTAFAVAKECGGVPIAIVTIAKALSNKETSEWRKVLRELRNPSSDSSSGIAASVYRSIELSYNYLETEEHKATFLLCSSMGKTYDASIEDLLRYGIGLGLFNRFNTIEEERDNVCSLVSTLKTSSLLVDAPKSEKFFGNKLFDIERFAMHDVVRDVARSIANKYKNVHNVIDNVVPRSWESDKMLENCTFITLHNVNELSEDRQLVCPQLKFLYLRPKFSLTKKYSRISDKFFARMPKLQVLHLIGIDLQTLSTPFSDLVNLRTLCLEQCLLEDVVNIGDLENLEILSFRGCTLPQHEFLRFRHYRVFKLPENMRQLSKLRLLELDGYGSPPYISLEFILSFKKLEALYMGGTAITWEAEKSNSGSRNASLDVLEHLSNLTSLEICVPDATMSRGLLSPKLERYNITIGSFSSLDGWFSWNIRCKTSRFLKVKLNTNEDGIISRLKPIRQLVLDEVPSIANNYCDLDGKGFPELEDLQIQNNSHILHIVDTTSRDCVFPVLKSLILLNLVNLKTIYNDLLGMKLFHQLRTIKVRKCHELTNLFSFASDRVFQELEKIEVEFCKKMKEIFALSEQIHEIKLSKLRILRLTSLPQLESLCCNVKTITPVLKPKEVILKEEQDVSKPLFNEKVVVTNLETLEISYINVKWIWDNQLPTMASIPNLTCLIISNLANLRGLGSGDYIKLPSLKEMTIKNCPKFEEFFFDDKVGVPNLEKINICRMDNLKMIWYNQFTEDSFPKLKYLQVQKCQNLLTLFPSNMCGSFLNLETLNVSECHSLEEIHNLWGINSEESHPTISTQSGELCTYSPLVVSFANLQNLKVSNCQRLKTLFSTSIVAKEEIFDPHELNSKEGHSTSTQSKELYTTVFSFANQQNFKVSECRSPKSLFSISNDAKERAAAKEAHAIAKFVFPKLTSFKLYQLPELTTFYPARYTVEWPDLKVLEMDQLGIDGNNVWRVSQPLPSLRIPNQVGFEVQVGKIRPNLLWTLASSVQSLTKLIVRGCGNLKELFPYSMVVTEELREQKTGNTIVFPKLNYLEMEQLANLKGFCSGCHIEFPILSEFKISNCPELMAFIFHDKVKVPSLKKLTISSMDNLKMIWDNQLTENSIPKLKSLQVQGCHKVLTLLQRNMCESFSSLETLDVSDCGSLEKIFDLHAINFEERHSTTSTQSKELHTTVLSFANLQYLEVSKCESMKSLFSISNVARESEAAKEAHATAKFVFPKLTSLKLYKLSEVRTFYPDRYTVEWPKLKRLQLWNCGIPDTDDEDQMQHLLFLVKEAPPCLEELLLSGRELMMMWQGQDPEPLFRNYKILEVLDESKVDKFFQIGRNCKGQPVLRYIGDMKYMWKQNFKLDLILPNFGKIVVGRCDSFISLMPPSASFRNLTSLEVNDCNSLEHIGTFSMAKNLVKLVSLRICRCEKIVEVLRNHEDVTGDKILFSNLKRLSLVDLPSLTSFCSWRFTLEFPSLQNLEVCGCPNMKIFSQGELTTPKLHEVKSGWRSIKLCPDIDVSTAIQQLHEQKQVVAISTDEFSTDGFSTDEFSTDGFSTDESE